LNPVKLHIDYCSYEAAKYAVMHWHYSKTMPAGKLMKYGVWENNVFIGCILFGRGAVYNIGKPYNLKQTEVCELVRVALTNHINPVSKILSFILKRFSKDNPGTQLIVSYADPKQNHNGGIYQATNWVYTGVIKDDRWININGITIHRRSAGSKYGSYALEYLHKNIDKNAHYVQLPKKHKYLYPLTKEIRKQIEKLRKPYPKKISGSSENSDTDTFQVSKGGAEPTEPLKVKKLFNEKD